MQSLGPKSTEEAMGLLLALDPWSTVMVSGDVHYTRVERGRLDAAMHVTNHVWSATAHNTLDAWLGVQGERCAHRRCVFIHGSGHNMQWCL